MDTEMTDDEAEQVDDWISHLTARVAQAAEENRQRTAATIAGIVA